MTENPNTFLLEVVKYWEDLKYIHDIWVDIQENKKAQIRTRLNLNKHSTSDCGWGPWYNKTSGHWDTSLLLLVDETPPTWTREDDNLTQCKCSAIDLLWFGHLENCSRT